jgi:hypothetical protein
VPLSKQVASLDSRPRFRNVAMMVGNGVRGLSVV